MPPARLGASAGAAAQTLDRLDRPLRDLRLSVIDQCNFRCTYCMPREIFNANYAFMPSSDRLPFEQMVKIARAFTLLGIEKIRITGGEPLLRRGLESLIEQLAKLRTESGKPMEIALTTNGSLLAAKARCLSDAGLHRVTVSLDAVEDGVFRRMSDIDMPVSRILDGIEAARAAGLGPVKVNSVIGRDVNDSQILPLVRLFKGTGVALRFIEYMDVGGANFWSNTKVLTARQTRDIVESVSPRWPPSPMRSARAPQSTIAMPTVPVKSDSSRASRIRSAARARARVSADGRLYTGLFAKLGTSLWPWLSEGVSAEQLAEVVRTRWIRRDDRLLGASRDDAQAGFGKGPTVRMSLVGG